MKKLILVLFTLAIVFSFSVLCHGDTIVIIQPTTAAPTNYTADANCQGAWLFADNLNDSSGEGNTLTATDATDYQETYPSGYSTGKSIHLDGTDDGLYRAWASLSANFPAKVSKVDFAFAIWIYRDDASASEELIFCFGGKDHTGNHGFHDYSGSAGNDLRTWIHDGTDSVGVAHLLDDSLAGTWTHIVFSFDGSANTGTIWVSQATFGSKLDASGGTFTSVDNIREDPNEYNFAIGTKHSVNGDWFDGYIYQPIIFDRTLNATEAEELYDSGITGAD